MAHTAAVFTLGTLVRKRIEKLRRKEKDVRVHNRRSALLWLGQDRAGRGWRRYFLDGVHPLYDLEVLFCCWLLVGQRFEVGTLYSRVVGVVGGRAFSKPAGKGDERVVERIVEDRFQLTLACEGRSGDEYAGAPAVSALGAVLNAGTVALAAECLGRRRC
jgi:hypothetical protein